MLGDPDALLGKEGYGFYSAMRWINGGRVSIAFGVALAVVGLRMRREERAPRIETAGRAG